MNRMAAVPARALPSWLSLASRTATCVAAQSARRWAAPASPADSMRTVSTGFLGGFPRGAAAAVASLGVGRLQFGVGSISGGIAGAQPVRWKVTAKKKQEKIDNEVNLPGDCHPQENSCLHGQPRLIRVGVSSGFPHQPLLPVPSLLSVTPLSPSQHRISTPRICALIPAPRYAQLPCLLQGKFAWGNSRARS